METVRHLIDPDEKINEIRGFIFISAHSSVTPFHIDRESNFRLQIRGQKTITLWDRTDRDIVPARDVENFLVYKSLDNVQLRDKSLQRRREFRCKPGDGVYFPSTMPHMTCSEPNPVETGDPAAISIGINFQTDRTRRNCYVDTTNGVLRRLGLKPRPLESGAGRTKYFLGKGIVTWLRLSNGYVPPPALLIFRAWPRLEQEADSDITTYPFANFENSR